MLGGCKIVTFVFQGDKIMTLVPILRAIWLHPEQRFYLLSLPLREGEAILGYSSNSYVNKEFHLLRYKSHAVSCHGHLGRSHHIFLKSHGEWIKATL